MLTGASRTAPRIGLVPSFHPSSGGEFQYSLSVIRALDRMQNIPQITVFARLQERPHLQELVLGNRFSIAPLDPPGIGRIEDLVKTIARRLPMVRRLRDMRGLAAPDIPNMGSQIHGRPQYGAYFGSMGADWVFYTAPNVLAFEAGAPFAMPIHDMQHRLQPQFPEVSAGGEFERREYLFGNAAARARIILVDSEVGKEDVLSFYGPLGLTEDRIGVLPYLPPEYLRHEVSREDLAAVQQHYQLPERYLFYPAQFWPHKNHRRLVEAVGQITPRHQDLNLVLVGTAEGGIRGQAYKEAMVAARRLNIESRIFRLGYVPNDHMAALYAGADALVFPTFFGPTNIPILEAWALGTPVITSEIRGMREQVGDAGILINPSDSESISHAIERVWTDESLRRCLADRGRHRLSLYDRPEFDRRLSEILARVAAG